jgi:hypothetical protein
MNDCVVVIRLKSGDELLAILTGEIDNRVMIEHPYYVTVNPASGSVTMIPYCPLTDEIYFELSRPDINFLVTANQEIALKFSNMINSVNQEPEVIGEDRTSDLVSSDVTIANIIPGNTTKH